MPASIVHMEEFIVDRVLGAKPRTAQRKRREDIGDRQDEEQNKRNEWQRFQVRLPDGLKPPLVWQSVYVVATAGKIAAGHVDVDDLTVARIED